MEENKFLSNEDFLIEFTDIESAKKLNTKNKAQILLPIDKENCLSVIFPQTERIYLPFYLKDFLKKLPGITVILDKNLKVVFSGIEKIKTKKITEKISIYLKNNKSKLLLTGKGEMPFETLNLNITPLTAKKEIFGYLLTGKNNDKEIELENEIRDFKKITEFTQKILFLKNKEQLLDWFKEVSDFLSIKTFHLYGKEENKYLEIFSYPKQAGKNFSLPPHIEKKLENGKFLELNAKIYPILNRKENALIYKTLEREGKKEFLILIFSEKNTEKIKSFWWLFEFLFTKIEKYFSLGIKLSDIFEEYPMPSVLATSDTTKIIYANKEFKKLFGENILFLNKILTVKSNLKLFSILNKGKDVFQDYMEIITADNSIYTAKANILPDIFSEKVNFFGIMFKIQKPEISTFDKTKGKEDISFEAILTLIEQYSSKLSKTKNIQRTINIILKDINKYLKSSFCFITKVEIRKSKISFPHFEPAKKYEKESKLILRNNLKMLAKSNVKKTECIILGKEKDKLKLLCCPFLRKKDFFHAIGIGFEYPKEITPYDKILLSNTGNIISIAIQKAEKEKKLSEIEKEREKIDLIAEEIVSSMSHEIKTPLTSILGLCELIDCAEEKEKSKIASSVKENAKKLLDLLESTLELSKLRIKGIEVIKKREINTEEFLNSIENFAQGINKNPAVKFNIKTGKILPSFYHDEGILFRIAVNLLDNAFANTERGMVTFYFSIENQKIILEVRDTGKGIAKENLNNIFLPFFQEKSGKNREGSVGLGLYIIKKLCDIIDAKIEVKSKLNIGTYFKITIPIEG